MNLGEVERIIEKRQHKKSGRAQYLVKWRGYSASSATWQPESHLKRSQHLTSVFNKQEYKHQAKVNKLLRLQDNISSSYEEGRPHRNLRPKIINRNRARIIRKKSNGLKKIQSSNRQDSPIQDDHQSQFATKQKGEDGGQVAYFQFNNLDMLSIPYKTDSRSDLPDEELFEEDPNFKVLEMCRGGSSFLYLIKNSTSTQLVSHEEVLREHTHALLDFYEAHLQFFPEQFKVKSHKKTVESLKK